MGDKTADKRRMDEPTVVRMEVGLKESFNKKLVRSRLTRDGHVERMIDEKLAKRTDAQKVEAKRRREDQNCDGDCIKRPRKSGRIMENLISSWSSFRTPRVEHTALPARSVHHDCLQVTCVSQSCVLQQVVNISNFCNVTKPLLATRALYERVQCATAVSLN